MKNTKSVAARMCTHALQWEREIERKENKTMWLELRSEQEHELSELQWKAGHKSTSHSQPDVDNGGGYACWGSIWEIFATSSQFCCELKTALKNVIKK